MFPCFSGVALGAGLVLCSFKDDDYKYENILSVAFIDVIWCVLISLLLSKYVNSMPACICSHEGNQFSCQKLEKKLQDVGTTNV